MPCTDGRAFEPRASADARRGWCRLEQWGHLSAAGTDGMYYYNGDTTTLDPIAESGENWFLDSIMVLSGDFTLDTHDSKKHQPRRR